MTELHDLLERAAGPHLSPDAADIAADVARGVQALRRRRTGVAGALLTAAVAAAAIPVGYAGILSRHDDSASPVTGVSATAVPVGRLVRYSGPAPHVGFRIGLIPRGWQIQGANAYRLTVAKIGVTDRNPDSFSGKLVVMLSTRGVLNHCPATHSCPRPVPGDGAIERVGYGNGRDTQVRALVLIAPRPDGAHSYAVQYPLSPAWTDDEIMAFARSVTVLPSARLGPG